MEKPLYRRSGGGLRFLVADMDGRLTESYLSRDLADAHPFTVQPDDLVLSLLGHQRGSASGPAFSLRPGDAFDLAPS